VAPSLFGVLRGAGLDNANELAGTIVGRLLSVINRGGFEIGLFLLITAFFVSKYQSRLARYVEMISLAIMAMMTGIGHWVISARIATLRAAMQTSIDRIAPDDPRRVEFASLHSYSVTIMAVALIAGLVAFVVVVGAKARDASTENGLSGVN
jgi:ABC-type transport system involved in cytochrome bd biosynthesis fused ATPase/permease subunit